MIEIGIKKKLLIILCSIFLEKIFCFSSPNILRNLDSLQKVFNKNPSGLRIFHPAFPSKILTPISLPEAQNIIRVKELTGSLDQPLDLSSIPQLPWKVFPEIGISEVSNFQSKSELIDIYEKNRHSGQFIWAHNLEHPIQGCLLLNHWKQQVVLLTEYDSERGAKGYELNLNSIKDQQKSFVWPPLALEIELTDGKWQPVNVSSNILSDSFLELLPKELPKALWELIFLLLISPETEPKVTEALLDTGLSPRKGLFAYLRLLEKVIQRSELNEDIPSYRQIVEKDIIL